MTADKHHNLKGKILNATELKEDDDEVFGFPDASQDLDEYFGVVHIPPLGEICLPVSGLTRINVIPRYFFFLPPPHPSL